MAGPTVAATLSVVATLAARPGQEAETAGETSGTKTSQMDQDLALPNPKTIGAATQAPEVATTGVTHAAGAVAARREMQILTMSETTAAADGVANRSVSRVQAVEAAIGAPLPRLPAAAQAVAVLPACGTTNLPT